MYKRNIGRWLKLYLAMASEFARFYAPQIKRLQRLIYMSCRPPSVLTRPKNPIAASDITTVQKYNQQSDWQNFSFASPIITMCTNTILLPLRRWCLSFLWLPAFFPQVLPEWFRSCSCNPRFRELSPFDYKEY